MTKIGLLREGKIPIDRRVPLSPQQCKQLQDHNPDVQVVVQKSELRCFDDQEYKELGIKLADTLEECDILLGVKEVPLEELIPDKTYLFFSHTIKEQPYNQKLLQKILEKNIRLIDYEVLTDPKGRRVVAFGRYAGVVGAYNGLRAYGIRYKLFELNPAYTMKDISELEEEYRKVKLPKIKIAITGSGRVAKGAIEVMNGAGIRHVNQQDYLDKFFDEPVYTQLNSRDYHQRRGGGDFHKTEFFDSPEKYQGDFLKYAHATDLLIAAAYWDPRSPVLFTVHDALKSEFNIKVIADVTCDIEGSIPSTKRATTIDHPFYDFSAEFDKEVPAFSDEENITVMAIDNLPNELPRNASMDFGRDLMDHVLPALIGDDPDGVIKRATLTENGSLTDKFSYLSDYAAGK